MANTTTTVVNSQLTVSEIPAQYFGVKISPHRIGKKQVVLCPWLDDHHPSLSVDNDKGVWNRLGAWHKGGDTLTLSKMAGVLPASVHFRACTNWGTPSPVMRKRQSKVGARICTEMDPVKRRQGGLIGYLALTVQLLTASRILPVKKGGRNRYGNRYMASHGVNHMVIEMVIHMAILRRKHYDQR